MKLPADAVVAREKVTDYLLIRQNRSDKSAFLASGAFTSLNPDALLSEIGAQPRRHEASLVDENEFGRYYEIVGALHGPLGTSLRVRTIWMTERLSGITKFITLIPVEVIRP